MDLAPGLGITARSPPTYIFWPGRPAGRARHGGALGGPAPSLSSTSFPACRNGVPQPGLLDHRSPAANRAPRSPGNPGRLRLSSRRTPEAAAGLGEWTQGCYLGESWGDRQARWAAGRQISNPSACADGPRWTGGRCWGTMLPPCCRQPPHAKAEQAFPPPPQSRISVL
ncbi:Hypothetical predicted protein [Marmota monax]|uniref:Uncharacterized protein n=1 Tax=Marmota monax TaxID=9995 RepID=A0A5E4BYX7_MARMO|nr:Hypothetical predicted protein [Marmota monax]